MACTSINPRCVDCRTMGRSLDSLWMKVVFCTLPLVEGLSAFLWFGCLQSPTMVSEDFRTLMRKIHAEGSHVVTVEVDFRKVNEGFTTKVTIELGRGLERETFHSMESDVLEYGFHLQNVVGAGGEVKLAPVRNLNQYFSDVDHLADQDNSKLL